MYTYTISETNKGNFIVQSPNGYGGLYPLITSTDDCRNTLEILDLIHEEVKAMWSDGCIENIAIEFRSMFDNVFTQE